MGRAIREQWGRLPTALRVVLTLAVLFLLVPWVSVQALPVAWAFIFGTWALAMFQLAFGRPRRKHRALWFNVGVALLTLAGAEVYLESGEQERARFRTATRPNYIHDDADLGYSPIPGSKRTITKHAGEEVIYEVLYTIDDNGVRVGPPTTSETPEPVVFFGCSMTYGEGLMDEQTYPYLVGALTGGRYATVNLAFSGYGPHQMLAMLESGKAEAAVAGLPRHAIYMAIAGHAARVSGNVSWDKHGPRYRLERDGSLTRDGQFVETGSAVGRRLRKWIGASKIHKRLFRRGSGPEEIELMAAIVAAARDRVHSTWPGCRFHVLLYDRPAHHVAETTAALEARGFAVHTVSSMLPGFSEDLTPYALHPTDGHPNARATQGIAEWIVSEILEAD